MSPLLKAKFESAFSSATLTKMPFSHSKRVMKYECSLTYLPENILQREYIRFPHTARISFLLHMVEVNI